MLTSFILIAMACMVMSSVVMAQPQQPPTRTPESMVQDIEKAVTLTADQKAKILKIYSDAGAKAEQDGRGGGFGFYMRANEAVEKVLTPDQMKKWQAYTLQQSIDNRINRIDQAVTLTAEQKTKIKPVIEKEITAQTKFMAEWRAQGENADQQAMRDKMTEIRSATDKALESILTKEQFTKYQSMPRRGMGGGRRGQ